MRKVKKYLSSTWVFFRKNYLYLIGGFLLYAIIFVNTFHESYPDEFDNILGGWYILQGKIIYKDFFTHHGPVAYFLAGLTLLFSGNSFVKFRIVYSIFLFLMMVIPYLYIRYSVGHIFTKFYIFLLYVLAVASVYFWGHMLLADSISGFFLMPAIALLILKTVYNKKLNLYDVLFISVLSMLSFFSSLTYTYVVGIIYLYTFFLYIKSNNLKFKNLLAMAKLVGVLAFPAVIYAVYLLITGSLNDYLYQNFAFNQSYYVYNYPRPEGSSTINPVRYAVVIANKFFMQFSVLLIQAKDFNFNFPFNITLAIANISLLVYLLWNRKFLLALFALLLMVFSNVRSEPLFSEETDYQSAVYITFSLFNVVFMTTVLYKSLKESIDFPKKLIYSILFLLLVGYGLFSCFYLLRSFSEKAYGKYMGTQPRIYDRPDIAPLINDLTPEGEYTWVGPFEFEELFYIDRPNASRYQIYNSAQGRAGHVGDEIIMDFERTQPKVIWFDRRFHILGENPEQYAKKFVSYLDENYNTLYGYDNGKGTKYVKNYPFEERVDIETKLYIKKENMDEVIQKLLDKGYIREEQQESTVSAAL